MKEAGKKKLNDAADGTTTTEKKKTDGEEGTEKAPAAQPSTSKASESLLSPSKAADGKSLLARHQDLTLEARKGIDNESDESDHSVESSDGKEYQ